MDAMMPVKVVILGHTGVGKTSIVRKYIRGSFDPDSGPTKGGMESRKTQEYLEDNSFVNFDIWDTAGQERYSSLASLYYKDADIALLVYDITMKKSFEKLEKWIQELKDNISERDIKIHIVANKSDLIEHKVVGTADVLEFASKHKADHHLTSAKDGTGINDLFMSIGIPFKKKHSTIVEIGRAHV